MFQIKNWEEYTYYLFIYLKDGRTANFRSDFFQLHRNYKLRYFKMLDDASRQKFYEMIKPSEFAAIFSKLDFAAQQSIIDELEEIYALKTIDSMQTDEIVQFLSGLTQEKINYYLSLLERHDARQIRILLTYETNTAGAIMTTEFVTATKDETVAGVLDRLRLVGKDAETIYYIYIVQSSNQLVGVISLRDLITSPRSHTMSFIMKERVVSVRIHDHFKKVFKIIKDYDLLLVPVTTKNNELVGIITIDDVMNKNTNSSLKTAPRISIKRRWKMLILLFLGFALVMVTTIL